MANIAFYGAIKPSLVKCIYIMYGTQKCLEMAKNVFKFDGLPI